MKNINFQDEQKEKLFESCVKFDSPELLQRVVEKWFWEMNQICLRFQSFTLHGGLLILKCTELTERARTRTHQQRRVWFALAARPQSTIVQVTSGADHGSHTLPLPHSSTHTHTLASIHTHPCRNNEAWALKELHTIATGWIGLRPKKITYTVQIYATTWSHPSFSLSCDSGSPSINPTPQKKITSRPVNPQIPLPDHSLSFHLYSGHRGPAFTRTN